MKITRKNIPMKGAELKRKVIVRFRIKDDGHGGLMAHDWWIRSEALEDFLHLADESVVCDFTETGRRYYKAEISSVDVIYNKEIWFRLRRGIDGRFAVCPCSAAEADVFKIFFGNKEFYDRMMDGVWWELFCKADETERPAWFFLGEQSNRLYKVEADSNVVELCDLIEEGIPKTCRKKTIEYDGLRIDDDHEIMNDGSFECRGIWSSVYYFNHRISTPNQLAELAFLDRHEEAYNLLKLVLEEDFELLKTYYHR